MATKPTDDSLDSLRSRAFYLKWIAVLFTAIFIVMVFHRVPAGLLALVGGWLIMLIWLAIAVNVEYLTESSGKRNE